MVAFGRPFVALWVRAPPAASRSAAPGRRARIETADRARKDSPVGAKQKQRASRPFPARRPKPTAPLGSRSASAARSCRRRRWALPVPALSLATCCLEGPPGLARRSPIDEKGQPLQRDASSDSGRSRNDSAAARSRRVARSFERSRTGSGCRCDGYTTASALLLLLLLILTYTGASSYC
jgi:hypothetical protein